MTLEQRKQLCSNREFWGLLLQMLREEEVAAFQEMRLSLEVGGRAFEVRGRLDFIDHVRSLPERIKAQEELEKTEREQRADFDAAEEALKPFSDGM